MRAPLFLAFLLALGTGMSETAVADVDNQLVFRRQSGETIVLPATAKTYAWCGDYEAGNVLTPTFHVITYDTTLTDRTYWRLWVILEDVVLGQPQLFPNRWTWPDPDSVEIFVGDPPNESATDTEDAAGSIVFQKLDCGEGGGIEFSIDARIGSEFGDGPWITVTGTFRATLTGSPFVPARRSTWGSIKSTYR